MSVRILQGDVVKMLATLADESVNTVCTSPPYWGLRQYIQDGAPEKEHEIGLEPTLAEHLAKLVEVFREVRRVMRPDATLWLNYGDAYNAYNGGAGPGSKLSGNQTKARPKLESGYGLKEKAFKPKDLLMMPERLAIAMQDDGWWVRSRIIWAKPNPMPESVTDRPTKSHEHIWLMSKAPRYYYDAEAIRETAESLGAKMPDGWDTGPGAHGSVHRNGREKGRPREIGAKGNANGFRGGSYVGGAPGPRTLRGNTKPGKNETDHRGKAGFNERWDDAEAAGTAPLSRNCRDVWTIATTPFAEAHFATFPPELAERCIKAGCPVGGTVLDPFGGSGTTGLVADRIQRNAILIELNPAYAEMARKRVSNDAPLFAEVCA